MAAIFVFLILTLSNSVFAINDIELDQEKSQFSHDPEEEIEFYSNLEEPEEFENIVSPLLIPVKYSK